MNVQRFTAPTSREAMAKARMVFGDSAVILSSRSTGNGFEVVATAEENLDTLAGQVPGRRTASVSEGTAKPAGNLHQRAAQQMRAPSVSPDSSVVQDTETLAMSTLSFQEYVRERMLRKRREMLTGNTAAAEPARASAGSASPAALAADDAMALPFGRSADNAPTPKAAKTAAAPSHAEPTATEQRLAQELNGLKSLIEERFNTLAWMGQSRQNPIQSSLMHKMIRSGYSPTVARAVVERLPAEHGAAEAFRWTQEVLIRNLKTTQDSSALCDEGGVFALIGPTGVGKTTTAAKLAAQCVKAYGANSVGLITLDTYRVAGYEQLRTYGRMLGVVAHLAHDRAALQDLMGLLANKRMVIIDTAGLGQKDPRIQEMMELLATPKIKKLLVVNAGSHGDTIDEVFTAYKGSELYGVVLSKIDEAAKLGPALDALIRHQAVLRGVCTGQRVPEDWQRPDAQALVRQSMASAGKSAFDPQTSELAYFFTEPKQAGVSLDGWHV